MPLVENKPLMQPFGDRSKVVIEPMLTDQWFVDTRKIVQPAIDAVTSGEVTIMPDQDRKVYLHWLENIEPWCISRQLWWGHQVPVWYGPTRKAMDEYCVTARLRYKEFCEDERLLEALRAGTTGWLNARLRSFIDDADD